MHAHKRRVCIVADVVNGIVVVVADVVAVVADVVVVVEDAAAADPIAALHVRHGRSSVSNSNKFINTSLMLGKRTCGKVLRTLATRN